MELLTISRSKSARRCWRHHYLNYEIGRVPIKTGEALFFGTLFHIGLEQWWLAWLDIQNGFDIKVADTLGLSIEAMRAKFHGGSEDSGATEFDLVKAEELMRGYHFRWGHVMSTIEIIAVESQFKMPLINPLTGRASKTFELGGKIDVRIRFRRPSSKTKRTQPNTFGGNSCSETDGAHHTQSERRENQAPFEKWFPQ